MHSRMAERVQRAIEERVFPGCIVGTIRANGSREILPFGHLTYESGTPAVSEDTIYDVASITKSIPTASLALNFLKRGTFDLSDPVKKYIPELQNNYGATIEDLLTYRVQGVRLSTLGNKSADDILAAVFTHGFNSPPGESIYTNLPALLLGIIIERFSGNSLADLAEGHFFMPLDMRDTAFFPPHAQRCAPTELDDAGEIRGIVHDESARVFAKEHRAVGHAGLFSTAPDMLNFLDALLQGKFPNIVDGAQKGLGWQVNDERFMGKHLGPQAFGKTGFTGTSVVCDIERGMGFVILSNRTYPHRPADDSAISPTRADVADIVFR